MQRCPARDTDDRWKLPGIILLTRSRTLLALHWHAGRPAVPSAEAAIRLGCQGINRVLAFPAAAAYSQLTRYICLYLWSLSRPRSVSPANCSHVSKWLVMCTGRGGVTFARPRREKPRIHEIPPDRTSRFPPRGEICLLFSSFLSFPFFSFFFLRSRPIAIG